MHQTFHTGKGNCSPLAPEGEGRGEALLHVVPENESNLRAALIRIRRFPGRGRGAMRKENKDCHLAALRRLQQMPSQLPFRNKTKVTQADFSATEGERDRESSLRLLGGGKGNAAHRTAICSPNPNERVAPGLRNKEDVIWSHRPVTI